MKAASVLMILLFSFLVCKAQTNSINMPNDTIAFSIQVKDRWEREVGYFRYNQNTNRLTTRGNQNKVWALFVPHYQQLWEVFQAQQKIIGLMEWDGTIKDVDAWKNAIGEYRRLKVKYGM